MILIQIKRLNYFKQIKVNKRQQTYMTDVIKYKKSKSLTFFVCLITFITNK